MTYLTLFNTECPEGSFGQNCRQNCSIHCLISGKCDKIKGYCIGGCQTGWKNLQCDEGKIKKYLVKFQKEI